MGKKVSSTSFDSLLETFASEDDRKLFSELADRNPEVRSYGLRQDDYSRNFDKLKARETEIQDQISELSDWHKWKSENWDDDQKMTKAEAEKAKALARLQEEKSEMEARLALAELGGDGMNFGELEKWGTEFITKNKLVTEEAIKAEKDNLVGLVKNVNQFTANAALLTPYLNSKHEKEFGEMFDPEEFVKAAVEKNRYDLKDFYEKDYVVEKRQQKMQADHTAEIERLKKEADEREKKAREEEAAKAQRLSAMGPNGMTPTDSEGPQMGTLQRKMLGLDKKEEGSGAPEVTLGEGGLAAYAARKFAQEGSLRQ